MVKLKLGSRENMKSRLGLRVEGGIPAWLAEREANLGRSNPKRGWNGGTKN